MHGSQIAMIRPNVYSSILSQRWNWIKLFLNLKFKFEHKFNSAVKSLLSNKNIHVMKLWTETN